MTQQQSPYDSPPWSTNTKVIVTVAALVLVIYIFYRFQSLISQIVAAAILAYILNPIIVLVDKRTPLNRGQSILIIFLLVAGAFVTAAVALGFAAVTQIVNLIELIPTYVNGIIEQITLFLEQPLEIPIGENQTIDLTQYLNLTLLSDQLMGMINPVVSQSGNFLQTFAGRAISGLSALLFIFIISIYIEFEIPKLGGYVSRMAHMPGYRQDAERLTREFGRIWSAYLRGQVILGLIIFVIVWLGLTILGVQNALALGILSGLLEFIPIIGPFIGTAAAIIVAFFQTPALGDSPLVFAGVVLLFMFLVQQIENAVLVPRIVGESLDLHPLIVMLAVFMGSSVAGILGAILAAPVFATLKLLGIYAWRKMFDQNPFPLPEPDDPPPAPSLRERVQIIRKMLPRQIKK